MVRARRAGMDLDCDHVGLAPSKDLEIRQQTRGDGVGDQAVQKIDASRETPMITVLRPVECLANVLQKNKGPARADPM